MNLNEKYNDMVTSVLKALAILGGDRSSSAEAITALLPSAIEDFEGNMRTLFQREWSDEEMAAISDVNYAYMSFVSECKKRFSQSQLGMIVNLTAAVHGLVQIACSNRPDSPKDITG